MMLKPEMDAIGQGESCIEHKEKAPHFVDGESEANKHYSSSNKGCWEGQWVHAAKLSPSAK